MASVLKHSRDATADDSDKTILTCPIQKICEIHILHVVYASTATVGNRQLVVGLYDSTDTLVWDGHAGSVQAASLTRHYEWSQGIFRETAFVDGAIQVAIPINLVLMPGWYLRVYDSAAIAAAADDMTTNLIYTERDHWDVKGIR